MEKCAECGTAIRRGRHAITDTVEWQDSDRMGSSETPTFHDHEPAETPARVAPVARRRVALSRWDTTAPSPSLVADAARIERARGTWDMNAEELAKVYAVHVGHYGAAGGWVYDANHKPIAQGWRAYARTLVARRVIVVGKGINWNTNPRSAR